MKNRDYKQFAPDNYFHVYNRGNGKMVIFRDEEDYKFFLSRLKENLFPEEERVPLSPRGAPSLVGKIYVRKSLPPNAFSLTCDCLIPNHFHLLIKQNSELPIGKLILKVCTGYSMYFNKKYDRVGSLFQDQFKAALVDDNSYLVWLSAYIHQNPKVAGLVDKPEDYKWSSYREFIKGERGICDKEIILSQFKSIDDYKKFVDSSFEIIKSRKDLEKDLESLLLD